LRKGVKPITIFFIVKNYNKKYTLQITNTNIKTNIYFRKCVFYNTLKHLEKYTIQPIQYIFVMMFGANKYILALNNLKGTLVDSI